MHFTRLSASVKTAFSFFLGMVSKYASLHLLRRLSRFPWYWVTMHAFHTHVCIGQDRFCVFLSIHAFHTLVCIRCDGFCVFFVLIYTACVSASVKTTFAFFFVSHYNVCVSHACLRSITTSFALQCRRFTHVYASVKTTFAIFFVSRYKCMRFTRVSASV